MAENPPLPGIGDWRSAAVLDGKWIDFQLELDRGGAGRTHDSGAIADRLEEAQAHSYWRRH